MLFVRVVALIVLAWLASGCGGEHVIPLPEWTIATPDAPESPLVLPGHFEDRGAPEETHFVLRTHVVLPDDLQRHALTLAVPRMLALAELSANGRHCDPLDTPFASQFRSDGPQRWRIDPEDARALDLELDLHTPLRFQKWIDTVPRLSATPRGDLTFQLVKTFNEASALAGAAMATLAGFPYLLIYLLDRRRSSYVWHAAEALLAAAYPLYALGLTQLPFGQLDGPVVGVSISLGAVAGVQFTHAHFGLGAPSPWLRVAWVPSLFGLFMYRPLAPLAWYVVPISACVLGCAVYQVVTLARLAVKRPPARNARLLLVSWVVLGVLASTEAFSWLGLGEPLDGLRAGSLGIAVIALMHSAALSVEHHHVLTDTERLNAELGERVVGLQEKNREVEVLNEELRRQIGARSKQMANELARDVPTTGERAGDESLAAGQLVLARYRVVRIVGSGGMGTVYEVVRTRDGKRLALKMLTPRAHPSAAARFAREAQIVSELAHPNVVSIVDVDQTTTGAPFLVMELVTGGSLEQERARFGDARWGVTVLHQIAEGLGAIHARGIVHRDLKPANVLLAAGGVVKIADFGIAAIDAADTSSESVALARTMADGVLAAASSPHANRRLTETGVALGTPLYMPPELARGARQSTFASDLFSLGVIAFEILTGEMPFQDSPYLAARFGLAIPPPMPIASKCAAVGRELAETLDRCLSFRPEDRPSLVEVARALGHEVERVSRGE